LKVTLNWLKEFLKIENDNFDSGEISNLLTMSGTEVKKVEDIGSKYKNFIVGRILEFEKHPDADKLSVCKVDIKNSVLNIVCGASNFSKNDKVVVALEGAVTFQGLKIKKSKLRGILSEGMLCSEYELGLSSSSEGILILDSEEYEAGRSFAACAGLDDVVLELEVTPNRPDCMSIAGIAREISAVKKIDFIPGEYDREDEINIDDELKIDIADYSLCRRYSAKIFSHVPNRASPAWLKNRLIMCDYRPVDLIVDLTNYVMHETGQPLHAFDKNLLYSSKIIVRNAIAGENIRGIDGSIRELTGSMLVIADEKKPVAIAGVMGGKETEINERTTDILLESANFFGPGIMKTSADLGLRTEASNRFEKKLDPEITITAIKRFEELLSIITGSGFNKGIYDNYSKSDRTRRIVLRTEEVGRILGKEINPGDILEIITGLGMKADLPADSNDDITVTVPSFRFEDLEREIDIIEEIARIHGFENFKSSPPSTQLLKGSCNLLNKTVRDIKRSLTCIGLDEVINYSFVGEEWLKKFGLDQEDDFKEAVRIINPINEDFNFLRTTPLPLMVKNLVANLNRDIKNVFIFEIAKMHNMRGREVSQLPHEKLVLGILISGRMTPKSWNTREKNCDFYDLKGIIEYLAGNIGMDRDIIGLSPAEFKFFHPVISGVIKIKDDEIGIIGRMHPLLLDRLDIRQDVFYSEIYLDKLIGYADASKSFEPIIQFPSIEIDIAVVVGEETSHLEIENEIRKTENRLLKEIRLFDIYRGKQIDNSKKSMAYKLTFQDETRTLKDSEVELIVQRILENLARKFNARLRE
jgi:phenylalanyl-tRNA synthetase beta chain